MNEIIKLIRETTVINEYGDHEHTFTERTVFATIKSIRQSEFYQAQAVGLKPEITFVLTDFLDYQDEKLIDYKPFGATEWIRFHVLRTYRTDNALEIICTRGID